MPEDKFDPFKFINQLFASEEKSASKDLPSKTFSDKRRLLDELENLTHTQRINRMYILGKTAADLNSANCASVKTILADLSKGNFYERCLSLLSCQGSRDGDVVFNTATKDPSTKLRGYAINLAASMCSDDQVLAIMREQSEKTQRCLLKSLRRQRRLSLIDQFIETLLDGQSSKLKNAIFFGSAECVQKHFHLISDRLSPQNMSRFSYQHAKLALEYLKTLAEASTILDPRLVSLANSALHHLAESQPDACITLVTRLMRTIPASRLNLTRLFRYRTNELINLLSASSELSAFDLNSVLHKATAASLAKVIDVNALKLPHHGKFSKLSLEARTKIYQHCSEGWRDGNGCLATNIIDKLQAEIRLREAKRHLSLPSLAARVAERLVYARYLTWPEALEIIQPVLDSSEVDVRAIGFRCLLPILRFQRSHRPDLLEILLKRKNEPDPVRLEVLSGLSHLPPSIWQTDDLDSLSTIIKDALSAADLSFTSLNYIGKLVLRLFRFHNEWSIKWIVQLAKDRGANCIVNTPSQFSLEELRLLSNRLIPVVKYWQMREEEAYLSTLARWYVHKLEEFPELIDALASLCQHARSEQISLAAARTLEKHATARFNDLLPELLSLDKSWGVQPIVIDFLHQRRQDLLTPYLGQKSFTGRFSTGKTRIVPNFTTGFHRWTTKQQDVYAKELSAMATDKDGSVINRMFGNYRLCLLPEPPMDVLRALSSSTNTEEKSAVLRDSTITHLGDLDAGQGIPILLEAVHDSRARLAIYALRKSVLSMPADAAIKILEQVPNAKISVFKEVIRLMGELKSESAFAWLMNLSRQDLNKDLQIALLRALWNYPDKDQTWIIFNQAIDSGNSSYIDTAIRTPADSLSAKAREQLLQVFQKAILSSDARARVKSLGQAASLPILDSKKILLEPLLKSLQSTIPEETRSASMAFFQLYLNHDQDVMKRGLSSAAANARTLVPFLSVLEGNLKWQRTFLLADATTILNELRYYPKTICWQIRIAAAISPWSKFHEFLKELDNEGQLNGDTLPAANFSFSSLDYRSDSKELEQLERRLACDRSENLRRIGLAALATLGSSASGWTSVRLDRLNQYRADSSLMVSSAATFTLPAVELQAINA